MRHKISYGKKTELSLKIKGLCISQRDYLIKERQEGLQSKSNPPAPHHKLSKNKVVLFPSPFTKAKRSFFSSSAIINSRL